MKKRKSQKIKKSLNPLGRDKSSLVACAFCQGRGVDPFGVPSKLSKCQVCKGKGKNLIPEPFEKCPACLGTGIYKHHRLSCAVCGGKGCLRRIPGKNRIYNCTPENKEMLDIETGLPCLSSYDLPSIKLKGRIKKFKKIYP